MISGLASLEAAPFDVGASAWVRTHAGEHDAPQGVVGLPVAGVVESEPVVDDAAVAGIGAIHTASP